jgi:MFS family permease
VADSLPENVRPKALGLLQALSAVGNVTAGLCAMAVSHVNPAVSWKYLFWIGSAPAFLCIFIMIRLKEPQKWIDARATSKLDRTKAMGSYQSLLGDPKWRSSALAGMLLCIAGVVGLWGVGFFSNQLVSPAIADSLASQNLSAEELAQQKQWWSAANLIVQNLGAFLGMLFLAKLAQVIGRKPAFTLGLLGAFGSTVFFYQSFQTRSDIWMSAVMGFFQLSLFAGFAIYLPELFPTRLRSTGVSFCYNVGRFIAATGPLTLAKLQTYLGDRAVGGLGEGATEALKNAAKLDAFRTAACWISCIYLMGLLVLPFLPETKGRPLPED